MTNPRHYPVLPERSSIRDEADGGILMSGRGRYRMISRQDFVLLRRIDGQHTAIELARSVSAKESDLAGNLMRLIAMAEAREILLHESASPDPMVVRLSRHLPFSCDAFSSPVMISLGLTSACNRRCSHCYRTDHACGKDLGYEKLTAVIALLADLDPAEINLTGGEPCLYPGLERIVADATSRVNSVTMSTNGTLLDVVKLRALADAGLSLVQAGANVIFDSDDEKQSGADRHQWKTVLSGAADSGVVLNVGGVLTTNVISRIDSLLELAHEMGAAAVRLGTVISCGGAADAVLPSVTSTVTAVRRACCLGKEIGIPVIFGDGLVADYPSREPPGRMRYCMLGTGMLHIEADGSIFPCSALLSPEFRLGSILDYQDSESLLEMWRNSPILRKLRNLTVDRLEDCVSCSIRNACGGGCRASAFWSTGDIAGRSPYCDVNRVLLGSACESTL